jgi:hypothetical protein
VRRALLAVAAACTLIGAVVQFVGLFFDYFGDLPTPLFDESSHRAFTVLLVVGVVAAAVMLLIGGATSVTGGALLGAIAATFVAGPTSSVALKSSEPLSSFGDTGAGYVLDLVGFAFVVVGAVIAAAGFAAGASRGAPWSVDPTRLPTAVLALAAGVVVAVGYGSNFFDLDEFAAGPSRAFGSPLIPSPRGLWGQIVAIVAIVVLPAVAVFASRRIAVGLGAGVLLFVVAELAERATFVVWGPDLPGLQAIEGVWVLAFGGFLLAVVLLARLVAIREPVEGPSWP